MMLAVMYGMMPSANTDSCSSAPPLNRLTRAKTPALLASRDAGMDAPFSEMPGVGSDAPSRKMAMMKRVKSSFLRRSGVRNARRNAVSMRRPQLDGSTSGRGVRQAGSRRGHDRRSVTRSLHCNSQLAAGGTSAADPGSRSGSPGAARRPAWPVHSAHAQSCVTVPPAAVILSRAEAEKACAVTRSAAPASPLPSTLTSSPARTAPLGGQVLRGHVAALGEQLGEPARC